MTAAAPRRPQWLERGHETGAVLVEALVAALIVAAMAGVWFDTLARGARAQRSADDRRLAMLVAQSQLATVGVIGAVAPGSSSGQDGDFRWTIAITPNAEAGNDINLVTVTVARIGGTELARLQTLRVGK